MSLIDRITAWCASHGRQRVIFDHLDPAKPYLIRNYLPPWETREHKLFAVCLHRILCSDADWLHDHPAAYVSCILRGRYIEHTARGSFIRRPGHVRFRSGRSAHRLELPWGPVDTLFVFLPRYRTWGFYTERGWVDHETHLADVQSRS